MKENKEELREDVNEELKEEVQEEIKDENSSDSESDIEQLTNKLIRLQADFINYRKRSEKEKESSFSNGIETFVTELLPILDNFQRALDSQEDKENGFYKGVEMIETQIIELLKKFEIEEIESLGKEFDPNFHYAITMEESDEYDSGFITDVLQKGYIFKDKVIRPSMVKVSK